VAGEPVQLEIVRVKRELTKPKAERVDACHPNWLRASALRPSCIVDDARSIPYLRIFSMCRPLDGQKIT
jgi:hypothetical protein